METQWINIADTAVKIGLGSVITGFFTFIGLRYSHKSQQNKYVLEHKMKLLEQITADIEEYFNALGTVTNKITGIAKHRKIQNQEEIKLSEIQINSIKEKDSLLTSSWSKLTGAVSKLRLIKANEVVSNLRKCTEIEKKLRDKIIFNSKMYTYDEIVEYGKQLNEAKLKVHNELSNFYDSLIK